MSASALPAAEPASAASFAILAAAEPSVMPRVLEHFASRGLVPTRWNSAVAGDDLRIELEVDGMDADAAAYVARRLRRIIEVRTVVTS